MAAPAPRRLFAPQPAFTDQASLAVLASASADILMRVEILVREVARAEILPRFKTARVERKPDGSLVTEADIAAQAALEAGLQNIVSCPVLGEEMLESEQRALWQAPGWCWCIDPLDGTGNFVNGRPYFGVSIALTFGRVTQLAVIFDPNAGELFSAVRGQGAWLNGRPLQLTPPSMPLREARAEAGLVRRLGPLKTVLMHQPPFARLSTSGASVLQWCHLAAGRYEVFLHPGENPWDYAAGALILEESGGCLCTFTHDSYWDDPAWQRSAIAAVSLELFLPWREWVRAHAGAAALSGAVPSDTPAG
jgi:myo-inositol-1(or 4)-monophosphatase